ncbi:hypothetical protein TRVA0_019S01112 [Trichomonascus vanleenenianus]|uniref:uncharacterized protein n=1 Tax=Trichomonascus vanleenenianus TaxID=2268995 RepID=UPI003EC95D60
METQNASILDKLPRDVWETVFDHLGPGLRQAQLACRFFHQVAVTRLWSHVCISLSGSTTASCSTWISQHNILFASQVLPSVANHIKKLTLELINDSQADSEMGYFYTSYGEKAIKLAMRAAEEIHLIVDEGCLRTKVFPVRKKLLEYLRSLNKNLTVTIDSPAMGHDDAMEVLDWFRPVAVSIEVNAIIDDFKDTEYGLIKYVRQIAIDFDAGLSDLNELLRANPRLSCLALHASRIRRGQLILPPHVSQFQICGIRHYGALRGTEMVTLSSKFVTCLQLATVDLRVECMMLDFPNVRSLELTAWSGFDDTVLERMKQLTKGLDRLVVTGGESRWLKMITPLICNVGQEIELLKLGQSTYNPKGMRKYVKDLVDFMSYSPTTPAILLELPFVEPELLAVLIKLLVDRCPDLKSLSTTDAYPPKELVTSARYPYLYRATVAHGYDKPAVFDINLRYIRGLGSTREVERLLDDVTTQWQAIPPDGWDMTKRRSRKRTADLRKLFPYPLR